MDFLSCDDALDYVTPFEPLKQATTEDDTLKKLQDAVQKLGFEKMMFAVIPQPKISGDAYMRSTYPDAWRNYYDQHNLRATDPTVAHCMKASSPFIWMPQSFKTESQQALYEEGASFGLRVGVTLPIHGPSGEVGMLTCVRDQAPDMAFLKDLNYSLGGLMLLRDVGFEALSKYINGSTDATEKAPVLTAREHDCLKWVTVGKTAWEIGRILNISEAGVNFHLGNLRAKFGVSRRNDIVVKAIRLGLVSLPT